MKKIFKNNDGAAMVSVMIAITFMSILVTSLLYMSYMNYLTKVNRHYSTDNFYTGEFALDDLSSSIQRNIALQYKTPTGSSKSGEELCKLVCGVTSDRYDEAKLLSMIQYANKDERIKSISVGSAYPVGTANYDSSASRAILKGVQITTETNMGHVTTITTDIIIGFPGSGSGDMDVNDFSIISNEPFGVVKGNVVMTGNIYVSDGNDDVEDSGECLTVGNGSDATIFTMLCPRGIIDGDITIEANAALSIAGDVAVNGDITVKSGGALFVSGTLTMNGTLEADGSTCNTSGLSSDSYASVIGGSNITLDAPFDLQVLKDAQNGKLSNELLVPIYIFDPTEIKNHYIPALGKYPSPTDSTVVDACWKEFTFDEAYSNCGKQWYKNQKSTLASPILSSKKYESWMGTEDTINDNDMISTLILLPDGGTHSAGTGKFLDTTVISKRPMKFENNARNNLLSFMCDKGYEECKSLLWNPSSDEQWGLGHKVKLSDTAPNGSYKASPDDLAAYNGNPNYVTKTVGTGDHVRVFVASVGSLPNGGNLTMPQGSLDLNNWPYSWVNYITFNDFINENSSSIITKIFNGFLGQQDPSLTTCSYDHWIKD